MPYAFSSLPFPERTRKPRTVGLTVVVDGMDSGYLGPRAEADLVETAGEYVDFLKIGWVLGALQEEDRLREKIKRLRVHGIEPFPGGMLLEVAVVHGVVPAVLAQAQGAGFRWLEVSASVLPLTLEQRCELIRRALDAGFAVLAEVGEKGPDVVVSIEDWNRQIDAYLETGAQYVVLESERVDPLLSDPGTRLDLHRLHAPSRLIFEVPYGYPFARVAELSWRLVELFGTNVNLANVEPRHVLGVETVRRRACFGGSFAPGAAPPEPQQGTRT